MGKIGSFPLIVATNSVHQFHFSLKKSDVDSRKRIGVHFLNRSKISHFFNLFCRSIVENNKEGMSLIGDELQRNRIAARLQAICAAKYVREDSVPCQIEQGLFMGSVGVALNRDALKRMNITHVLIVAKSLDPPFPIDFIYKKIEVLDTTDTNLSEHFDECFDFINEAKRDGGGVLVHCFAGKSRSGTIVVAYLMKQHRMSLSDALELVRSKRPQVQPNCGFMIQLRNFEKSLKVLQANSG